ncbi:ABC transporter substrate-binding protein [Microbacterium sp. STN6]|uniref:ABC transporter substrate-binding protein n=1 Tax=Microbacterium sp. STN6 TaxID=2995588 RepID=UPI002260C72B|nr:ABC transporter substrate-binding protein [Microbacterium sp. STN6]MCX7522512.1 ABC transporter substrate-binding protein [Microbacterium sp. STN6]
MRTTRRRRLAALAAAAAVATLLAACSSAAPENSSSPDGVKGKKITVWFPGTNQTEIDLVEKTIVPQFEKKTGATVDVAYYDWGDLSTKLNAAFAAGTAPDVFGHGPAAVADFVTNDRLEPLTRYVAAMPKKDREDLASALPGGQVGGVQYLMPLSMQGTSLVYRAADFTAAGLDPDNPPTTWEGVYKAAEKLTKRDASGKITHSGLLLPSQATGRQQTFAALIMSAGGSQVSTDMTKATFDSAKGVKAMNFFTKVYNGSDAVAAGLGSDYSDAPANQQPLVLGTASIAMQTADKTMQMIEANPDLDLRVMTPPKFEGAKKGYGLGGAGSGLMINADSTHKNLDWTFIKYMISAKVNAQYTEGIGKIPARTSAIKTDYVKGSPILSAFVKIGSDMRPNPNVPGWVQIRDTMDKYIEQGLHQQLPAEDALSQAADEANKILKANG